MGRNGVTTETFDNSDLLVKMDKIDANSPDILAKIDFFNNYSNFSEVPKDAMISLAKASVAIDQFIKEYSLDAIGLRCWNDLQLTAKISPLRPIERTQRPGKILEEVDAECRRLFPNYRRTVLVYFEGCFGVPDLESRLMIRLTGTDLT